MKRLLEWKKFVNPWEEVDDDIHLSKKMVREIVHDIAAKHFPVHYNVFGTPDYIREKKEQMIKTWHVELTNLSTHAIDHNINNLILIKMVDEIKDKFEKISGCEITYKIKIEKHEYGGDPELRGKTFNYFTVNVIFTFHVPEEGGEIK